MSFLDVIWKLIRYNMRIVFGNKFIYFLLGALGIFLFITTINVFEDSNPNEETLFYILLFPGILLIFYPATYGIQNDEDARILEILFGIPNYRFKVWLVRLLMIYILAFMVIYGFAYLGNLLIYPTNVIRMVYELMFPIFFLGCLAFMLSTLIRNGNGTAVVMIIVGIAFWISAGILEYNAWNIFLNPFANPPSDMNEVVWNRTIFQNRIYLFVGTVLAMIYALMNMQKREKFV